VILFLNDLIVKLIDEECLKEENEKLALMSKKKNYKDKKKKKNKKRNVNKNKNENEMYIYCKKAVHSENNYWKLHLKKMSEKIKKK